ncbi:MAG TPA: AAA family ATPase [Thermoanaerobaculia bacterium]
MRLLELHLKAFGPFTDRRLDLSGGEHGLHLVFGPNEAGKSSALRALKALLYGFPDRTGDDFLHPYDQLRIGGRLRLGDGSELEFLRRKGRKKGTLLSVTDESLLDEGLLDRCLQGVEEKLFSSLFGIDHDALVQGGQELLEQKGDVGQALFAAGLGTRNLRKVLASLDEEAESLFVPRGSKRLLNQQIADFQAARKALADLSLSGRDWEGRRKDLEKKREEWGTLERELADRKGERNRLQRLRRALPNLGLRRDLLSRRESLGPVVVLPAGFTDLRREAQEAIRAAAEGRARAGAELREVRDEAATLKESRALLDQAETIERLHRDVGRYAKDVADRLRLLKERDERRATAEALLDEIRPGLTLEEADTLRPALDRWRRIQELAQQRQSLFNGQVQARQSVQEVKRRLAATRDVLESLPRRRDPASLRRRAEAARRAGDLDRILAEAADALRRDGEQLRVDFGRLGLWTGAPEEMEALPVPGADTLDRFRNAFDALAERRRGLDEQRRTLRADLAEVERRLEEIRRAGAVPTEQELLEARERRDRAWRSLRQAWAEEEAKAYEEKVGEADELADRLRREADRVQQQAQLLARRDALQESAGLADQEEDEASRELARLQEDWKRLWRPCGIDPLPPREMHPGWTSRQEKLRDRAEILREQRGRAEALERSLRDHRAALARELKSLKETVPAGDDLEPVLAQAEDVVRRLDEEGRQREQLVSDLKESEAELVQARETESAAVAAFEEWRAAWAEAVQDLGTDRDALPPHVLQLLDNLRKVFSGLHEAASLDRRIAGIDRDLEDFRASVRSLALQVAPELADHPADQATVQLQALLTEARRQADRRADLDRRMERLEKEIRDADATVRAMEDRLAQLRREAGCDDDSGLQEAERRSALHQELTRDLERTERQLLQDGEGLTLDELEKEAEGVDADALPGHIDQLGHVIEDLEKRSGDLREELGKEQKELEHMTGGDAAAREAERAQEILASLRHGVERYVRVRLASAILKREIDRYREENQAPLLRRAGDLFATLTCGSFRGLQTDYDDRDEPVLVGLRQDGRRVRVEGMSDGTRDQLYLSLRLATLERYLAHAEPLPFIVDDILINFDDERTAATLKVLADLSTRTQVILFTHHGRLKDLAAGMRNGSGAGVFVRELRD